MRFALTDDQSLLRDAVRDALADACPPDRVRAAWSAPDTELWALLADLGVLGLEVSPDSGGMGLGPVELAAIAVELGRVAFPGPAVETLAAAPLLPELGHDALTEGLVAGDVQITAALDGQCHPHADQASLLLTVLGDRVAGLIVQSMEPVPSVDGSRRLFRVDANHHSLGDHGTALFDRCALATAAELVGLSEAMLDLAVDYAKQRKQFGKPIGAFQAIQHHLANALLALRFATPPLWRAAWSLEQGRADASVEVSAAKAAASDAADVVARTALQVHGAIGYTWEFDLHLFHKRAIALQRAWGDASWHRARIARARDLPGAPDA